MRVIKTTFWTAVGLFGLAALVAMPAAADQVILDDLIVDGSICAGFDCVNGESFGFDTIRMKENNLRLKAQDTSTTASFPSNDWQLTFNDSSNGGANKFSVDDISGGRTPFTLEAGAPSHSLFVDDGGRLGFGTNNPVTDLHVKSGNTPTLRLEQDGSSGFTPQTFDVAANEANFFIRDVTNGSTLPFRIRPGAGTSEIDIQSDETIDFLNGAIIMDEDGSGSNIDGRGIHVVGAGSNNFAALGLGDVPQLSGRNCAANIAHDGGAVFITARPCAGDELIQFFVGDNERIEANTTGVDVTGNLTITGTCSAGGGACDFVFDPEYRLESIDEHAALMWENSYLPAVGPTPGDNGQEVRINVFEKTAGILNELEKAHIYIEQLHNRLQEKEAVLGDVLQRLEALEQPASK